MCGTANPLILFDQSNSNVHTPSPKIVDYLNLLFGLSSESLKYWNGALRKSVNASFFYQEKGKKRGKGKESFLFC